MKRISKAICILIAITIMFTSCSLGSSKTLEKINSYIANNEFNACLQYINKLEQEEKNAINNDVCITVINKFNELKNENKINLNNIYDLSAFDTDFAENCQKLWNIMSEFSINKEDSFYSDCIYLRYFAEMIDYTRYCEIYSLLKKVNQQNYLDKISTAIYEYESKGTNTLFQTIYEEIEDIDYNRFNPQQYLVLDFKNAYESIKTSMYDLNDAFSVSDSNSVAVAINNLTDTLTDVLFITDTLLAVSLMQRTIYSQISTENIFSPLKNEISVSKREYVSGMSFSLDSIFGITTNSPIENESEELTSAINTDNISKEATLTILVNAINKTKSFNGDVSISLKQIKNIQLSGFKSDRNIKDADEMTKSQIKQSLQKANGTIETTSNFSNGSDGTQTLNDFVPPSSKNAIINSSAIIEHSCIKGSGGYIIKLKLDREFIKTGQASIGVNSLVNTFEYETRNDVKKFETSYAETVITAVINNNGKLAQYDYTINGVNKCYYEENNGENNYEVQYNFNNTYSYKFTY